MKLGVIPEDVNVNVLGVAPPLPPPLLEDPPHDSAATATATSITRMTTSG
jgi:hypothetical protein